MAHGTTFMNQSRSAQSNNSPLDNRKWTQKELWSKIINFWKEYFEGSDRTEIDVARKTAANIWNDAVSDAYVQAIEMQKERLARLQAYALGLVDGVEKEARLFEVSKLQSTIKAQGKGPWLPSMPHTEHDYGRWVLRQNGSACILAPEHPDRLTDRELAWIRKWTADFRPPSNITKPEHPNDMTFMSQSDHLMWHTLSTFLGDKGYDFSYFEFPSSALFERAHFGGAVKFSNAKFHGDARFGGAVFEGDVNFDSADFCDDAWFGRCEIKGEFFSCSNVNFRGSARFREVQFRGVTLFEGCVFHSFAWFPQAQFSGYTSFSDAKFMGEAIFGASKSIGSLTLFRSEFAHVPDFTEANFTEAPILDTIVVPVPDFKGSIAGRPTNPKWQETSALLRDSAGYADWYRGRNRSAMWRALRRLAEKGNDHQSELKFNAAEIREQRYVYSKKSPLNDTKNIRFSFYWLVGIVYDILSDCGRSIHRPFLALLFTFVICTAYYHVSPEFHVNNKNRFNIATPVSVDIMCDKKSSALYISLKRTSIVSIDSSEQFNQHVACIYGQEIETVGRSRLYITSVPMVTTYIGIFQTFLSTIFIFLIFLALKNAFRIK
jgi:uncharacterized protein YjbI with pentapeptide repeats